MKKIAAFSVLFLIVLCNKSSACEGKKVVPSVDAVTVTTMIKSTKDWQGNLLPAYPAGQPEITMLKIVVPAGMSLPNHYHPVIHGGVLVRGQITVVDVENNKRYEVKAGDTIVETVNRVHYGISSGAEDAEIIVFYAGIENMPITILAETQAEVPTTK